MSPNQTQRRAGGMRPRRGPRRLIGALIVAAIAAVTTLATDGSAAATTPLITLASGTTTTVLVDALEPGAVATGVTLVPGQKARITATGHANCDVPDPEKATLLGCNDVDANGSSTTPAGPGFLAPGLRAFARRGGR